MLALTVSGVGVRVVVELGRH
ncbi:unnamed protein product [Ectocarpus sp. CCAP 1310/34]|nr:unnamed protein product [Ectocarpus sp. CCAP 1310/34]